MPPPIALTIAGSDPSGGAGLQADLKTFHQHGVYGMSVVTLVTVQNTVAVPRVEVLAADLVDEQLAHLLRDLTPAAAKTGALGSAEVVRVVARHAARFTFPLVVDPVMVSKHGHKLVSDEAAAALVESLFPHVTLLTPNAHEAGALLGQPVRTVADAKAAAKALQALGPQAVLVKGGHLDEVGVDVLSFGGEVTVLRAPRVDTTQTHGTGCTLSAAITAQLALGRALPEAVSRAKAFLTEALRTAPGVGTGVGPVNHFAPVG